MKNRGSILVGVLWCLTLLSVVVVGVLHTARMDLLVVKNYGDRLQAHYIALAGVERAKALIYHDYITRRQTGTSHTGALYDDSKDFESVAFDRGHFRVFHRADATEGGGLIYGISDEESRLNINTAFEGELTNIVGMTPDLVASILSWRSDVGQGSYMGAAADYYASLEPPYQPRNGPFQTVRELLMVRGVTPLDLLGGDVNQEDILDTSEDQGDDSSASSEGGWSAILTANSTEKNLDAGGKERVNVQTADESDLEGVQGISSDIAHAIVSYRGQKQLQGIGDLLDVTNTSGQTAIDDDLFIQIADGVTTSEDADVAGMININTAGVDVLSCLPGMDRALAQAMINYRQSSGFFANVGSLLRAPGMNHDIFKQIAPLLTARSETFRITSEGKISSTGARQRIQAIVHIASREITTLSYREDL